MLHKDLSHLKSRTDIAALLGVSEKQLNYITSPNRNNYFEFTIQKRSGKERIINAPNGDLKYIQTKLSYELSKIYQPRFTVHGFCKSKSIVTNAEVHKSARHVFNLDLKDFFPSVNFGRVRGLFLCRPFNANKTVATTLAQICCHLNKLPQGAPTSPIVSNMICSRLDGQLIKLARTHYCNYSRYVDDLTFSKKSGNFPTEIGYLSSKKAEVSPKLESIIESNGFQVNKSKVYLFNNKSTQIVTGLVVNKKVNVPRSFIRQLRAMIHACKVHGLDKASKEHFEKYYSRSKKTTTDERIESVIRGKLDFLKSVKGVQDPVYKNLQRQFVEVVSDYSCTMQKENSTMSNRDIFISHASEDKATIAKPLADQLISMGVSVWYDEYELQVGDSLREKIDDGLANSKYGVVILSNHFFSKNWTKIELNGLVSLSQFTNNPKLLPIWHNISHSEVASHSPIMSDILALDSKNESISSMAEKLKFKVTT